MFRRSCREALAGERAKVRFGDVLAAFACAVFASDFDSACAAVLSGIEGCLVSAGCLGNADFDLERASGFWGEAPSALPSANARV